MEFKNITKADSFHFDTNGVWWVFGEKEEILLINNDGLNSIPFCDLDDESLAEIKKGLENKRDGFVFTTDKKDYQLRDLLEKPERD